MCGVCVFLVGVVVCFFFQAEDGIRDLVRSRGLGDVYKRQGYQRLGCGNQGVAPGCAAIHVSAASTACNSAMPTLSLIHI